MQFLTTHVLVEHESDTPAAQTCRVRTAHMTELAHLIRDVDRDSARMTSVLAASLVEEFSMLLAKLTNRFIQFGLENTQMRVSHAPTLNIPERINAFMFLLIVYRSRSLLNSVFGRWTPTQNGRYRCLLGRLAHCCK